jgi:hypothetical protein
MSLALLSLLAVVCVADARVTYPSFTKWAALNNRTYEPTERDYRNSVYVNNVRAIRHHNAGNHSWTMAVNKFADLTAAEFQASYVTGGYSPRDHRAHATMLYPTALPASVNWTAQGAVTPVKNQ